jgi:hypothetical protein
VWRTASKALRRTLEESGESSSAARHTDDDRRSAACLGAPPQPFFWVEVINQGHSVHSQVLLRRDNHDVHQMFA